MSNRSLSQSPPPPPSPLSKDFIRQQERLEFCKYFLKEHVENPSFINSILFIDETTFKLSDKYSINICVCIIGDYILGPCLLQRPLTEKTYKEFLESISVIHKNKLKLVRLVMRDDCGCRRCNDNNNDDNNNNDDDDDDDGFSDSQSYYYDSPTVIDYLNSKFPNNCIFFPRNSPDLNPLKFYLWKHLKMLVYQTDDEEEKEEEEEEKTIGEINFNFWERINNKFNEIQHFPGVCQRIRDSMLRRAYACIYADGGNFDYFL